MYFNITNIPLESVNHFRNIVDKTIIKNDLKSIENYKDYSTVNANQFLLYNYISDLEEIIDYYESNIFNAKLIVNNCWTIYGSEGAFHIIHQHSSSGEYVENRENQICTVLYLKTNNDEYPNSVFYAFNPGENDIVSHLPKDGDLIIFSPDIWHGAYPQGKGLRHTLNLDFTIIK